MTEIAPKTSFADVIAERKKPILDEKARAGQIEKSKRDFEREISRREKQAEALAKSTDAALTEKLGSLGISSLIHDAVKQFGNMDSDPSGKGHSQRGNPKKVGAYARSMGHYVFSWSNDREVSGKESWLQYAINGVSLNYLTRSPAIGGYRYSLSRYAVVLGEAPPLDERIRVWHGELPEIQFDSLTGRSSSFDDIIKQAVKKQDDIYVGRAYFRPAGNLPLPEFIQESEQLDESTIIDQIHADLYQFAQSHFVPSERQIRERHVLLPSLFSKKSN